MLHSHSLRFALSLINEGAFLCELDLRTVAWNAEERSLRMIDQRRLPAEVRILTMTSAQEVAEAIHAMAVRGAPAIGAAAAFGLALTAVHCPQQDAEDLWSELQAAAERLRRSRPTAVNLAWALNRVLHAVDAVRDQGPDAMRQRALGEAQRIADEDVEVNRRIGQFGAALLPDPAVVIHHCNTGALATVDYGTALGVIRAAHESGKHVHVLVDETRPRLQGARLTAWELQQYGIPFEIISDNAAGFFLQRGEVDAVLVGADRVAANGDVANKIGTYMLALAAHANQVPVYCAVPTSTIDLAAPDGGDIPIEERDPGEVLNLQIGNEPVVPQGSQARNPAFDITPYHLISAFITERGILEPPFDQTLRQIAKTEAQPK